MEKIDFEEVLNICNAFNTNPKENLEQLEKLQNKLQIKSYLPMELKVVSLFKMTADSDRPLDVHPSIFTSALELAFLFDGLLMYTNINENIPMDLKIYESYDSIYQSGLADYILQFCERDYNKLICMMERTISYENVVEFIETMQNLDTESLQRFTKSVNEFKNELDPNILRDAADVARYNDPMLYKLKEEVLDSALDQIERMDTIEKNKKKS